MDSLQSFVARMAYLRMCFRFTRPSLGMVMCPSTTVQLLTAPKLNLGLIYGVLGNAIKAFTACSVPVPKRRASSENIRERCKQHTSLFVKSARKPRRLGFPLPQLDPWPPLPITDQKYHGPTASGVPGIASESHKRISSAFHEQWKKDWPSIVLGRFVGARWAN
jgi:hypothetical protein